MAIPRWGTGPCKSFLGAQNLAVLFTHCGQLILGKITKPDATRCQISRLKCTQFDFRRGSAPAPAVAAYGSTAGPLAVFKIYRFF